MFGGAAMGSYREESMTYTTNTYENSLNSAQIIHNRPRKDVYHPPVGSVLLGVLKSVEQELSSRELLGIAQAHATPLWFLAETERNIYLWRQGYSIEDQHLFSFWIDIRALIAKRKSQLHKTKGSNPFIAFGNPNTVTASAQEAEYLEIFEELSSTIIHYAEAVSRASRDIIKDLYTSQEVERIVVLPSGRYVDYNKKQGDLKIDDG